MAITILTQPQLFTTTNLALFKVVSDRPTIQQFKVEVLDDATGAVISVQKYYTIPMINLGTSFNLSPLLSSFVSYELDTSIDFLKPISRNYRSYRLNIQEIYLVGSTSTLGDSLQVPAFHIFNSTLSRSDFSVFDYRNYVANSEGVKSIFLSKRAPVSNIYQSSLEYLYFLSNVSGKVKITFYKKGGVKLSTHYVDFDASQHKSFRVNLTPFALSNYFGSDLINEYGGEFMDMFDIPFGSVFGILDANYFTVELTNPDNETISEKKTYILKADKCRVTTLQSLFLNNLGGFDSMIFVEPKQTVNSEKTTINLNPFQYNSNGDYTDKNGNIFNPDKVVISSKNTSSFSAISEPLNDNESLYSRNIIESDFVLIRLNSKDLLPVVLDSQDYLINKIKYNTNNYRLTANFKIQDTNFIL